MFVHPTGTCGPFAVLFGMSVLRHDVLGGQGNDLCLSGANDHWGNRGMVIEGLAIGELPGETILAMHGFGRKIVGALAH
jgi:hypothetical protein